MTTLYINRRKVDSKNDLSVTLTYRSSAFLSVDKINCSYSNTISLPRTALNESIFGVFAPSTVADVPYKYLPACIEMDGVMIISSALACITEVTTDEYKIALVWDSAVKLAQMAQEEKKLNELSFDVENTSEFIIWGENVHSTNPKLFPIVDWGFNFSGDGVPKYTTFHPALDVPTILKRVCAEYGITPPPDEDLAPMERWRLPLPNRVDPIITNSEHPDVNNYCKWQNKFLYVKYIERQNNTTKYRLLFNRKTVMRTPQEEEDGRSDSNVGGSIGGVIPRANNGAYDPSASTDRPQIINRELGGWTELVPKDPYDPESEMEDLYFGTFVPINDNLMFIVTGDIKVIIAKTCQLNRAQLLMGVKLKLFLKYKLKESGVSGFTEDEILSIDCYDAKESSYNVSTGWVRFKFTDADSDAIPIPLQTFTVAGAGATKFLDARLEWRITCERQGGADLILQQGTNSDEGLLVHDSFTMKHKMKEVQLNTSYYYVPNLPQIKCIDFLKGIAQMSGRYINIEGEQLRFRSYDEFANRKGEAVDWSDLIVGDGNVPSLKFKFGSWAQKNIFQYKESEQGTQDKAVFNIANETLDKENEVTLPFTSVDSRMIDATPWIPMYKYTDSTEPEYEGETDKAYIAEANGTGDRLVNNLKWSELLGNYSTMINVLKEMKVIKETITLSPIILHSLDLSRPVYLRQYGAFFAIVEIRTRSNGTADVELLKI